MIKSLDIASVQIPGNNKHFSHSTKALGNVKIKKKDFIYSKIREQRYKYEINPYSEIYKIIFKSLPYDGILISCKVPHKEILPYNQYSKINTYLITKTTTIGGTQQKTLTYLHPFLLENWQKNWLL